jgi:tetratricopeptide (TPR) repeat protein
MQQQKLEEAIPWLEKAKQAKRYEPRHFPYINLGRVYLAKGMIRKALEEFRGALKLNPDDGDLVQIIEQLETNLQ